MTDHWEGVGVQGAEGAVGAAQWALPHILLT